MRRSIICYYQPGKRRARKICEAFARGCAGQPAPAQGPLQAGPAAFYGLRASTGYLWRQAVAEGRDWYFIDNKYLGDHKRHYRVTRRALQSDGIGRPEWERLKRLAITVEPWQPQGRHVLVCPQSDEFFGLYDLGDWLGSVMPALQAATDREIRVRRKNDPTPFMADLAGAHAVVVHSSNAAVDALLAGVPVVVTGWGPAFRMGRNSPADIENLVRPDDRQEWAAILAGQQWSMEEMRSGACWRDLQRA